MILFESTILKLDYNPATDILDVVYPDLHGYLLPEIKHNINTLVNTVKNYDVKKMLLDASNTVISVSAEESREISLYLAAGLVGTRLQKLARVQSPSEPLEARAKETVQQIHATHALPFELRGFAGRPEALAWLQE